MSTSRGSGGASNGGGALPVPAGSLKIVQSLKEIVNCSEAEIYATLKDCNMDPNEAVNRLLSQDPFHEVKSKREKKKEGKDTTESRPRGLNNNSSRGSKTSTDRHLSRGGTTPYYSSESAPLPGKLSYKKENGSNPYSDSLSSMHGVSGKDGSRGPTGFSDGASAENKGSSFWTADAMPHGMQPASEYQSAWSGPPGQVSMADIVKMGKTQNKEPNAPNLRFPEDHQESGISSFQHFPTNEEWPSMSSIENPAVTNVTSVPEYTLDNEQYIEAHDVPADYINQPYETEDAEGDGIENSGGYILGSDSFANRKITEDDSRSASLFEKDLYNNLGSFQHQTHDLHEDEDFDAPLSSVTRNLQQLNVEKDDSGLPSEGYAPVVPSVVIPDHLQVQNVDCSHLSFGSFGPKKSLPVALEQPHNEADVSSVHLNNRSSEYYVDDSLGNASDVGLFHRTNPSAGSYDPSLASQLAELKQPENAELGNQYSYHPSNHGYTFDDAKHLNVPFSQSSSQMQNLASFSKDMPYTNSLPSILSPANVHITGRESDIQLSQYPATQSMSSKYGNFGSSISVTEALKTGGFSSTQPALQALSGTGVATGPSLPQHLSVHQFSQATHPLGPYANMIGYPFMPQSYTYVPSAFQQAFAGNSAYHQSLASLLPQYKNSVSSGSLTQSAAGDGASGYAGAAFGNTTAVPGNFQVNHTPAAAPLSGAQTLSYDDVLSSQYKDNTSHLVSLQRQNENSGMWLHGLNSRTMPAAPASNYYNYQQGQNQQSAEGFRQGQQPIEGFRQGQQPTEGFRQGQQPTDGFRQGQQPTEGFRQGQQPAEGFRQGQQQPSLNYGTHGYQNFYNTQGGGISLDQQQNLREGSLGASQGQPKQSQIWHNGY